jgi:hypothetical protein
LKEEAVYHTLWRTGFGRGYGHIVRQTRELMDEWYEIGGRLKDECDTTRH